MYDFSIGMGNAVILPMPRVVIFLLTLQRNLMVSGAMGRFERPRSEGPKGRRWNCPHGVAGIAKKAILRCSVNYYKCQEEKLWIRKY